MCIGADTRSAKTDKKVRPTGETYFTQRIDTVCKIFKVGNIYFSITGYDFEDVLRYASLSCEKGLTIEETAKYYQQHFKDSVKAYLTNLRSKGNEIYTRYFKELERLNVLFYGFENNLPKLGQVEFQMLNKLHENISLKDTLFRDWLVELPSDNPSFAQTMAIGYHQHIDKLINVETWHDADLTHAISRLIGVECDSVPAYVARPIDVLMIDRNNNYKWTSNSNSCQLR